MVEQAIACGGLDKSDMYCPRGSLASTRAVALKFGFNIFYVFSILQSFLKKFDILQRFSILTKHY